MKEHEKAPEKKDNPKEMDVGHLPTKEFKKMVITYSSPKLRGIKEKVSKEKCKKERSRPEAYNN